MEEACVLHLHRLGCISSYKSCKTKKNLFARRQQDFHMEQESETMYR